jgi:hypothetical protein
MLKALREKAPQARIAGHGTIPAPTKGWVVFDNLAAMPEGTAYLLENAFPSPDYVRVRGGASSFATGMGSSTSVESLLVYASGSTEKLFACGNGSIWDITSGGAVGAAAVTTLNGNRWESVNMTTTGGSFLFCLNGQDDGRLFDGASWTTTAVTGVNENVCNAPVVYKNRIYFLQNNTTDVWYLNVDSIAGAATKFALGGVFQLGGSVVAAATWSVDSGSGQDDKLVFLSSEGEVAVYEGTFPGDTATWGLIGVYYVGKPVGAPRCVQKFGGDLGVLTELGIVPMSKAVNLDKAALSNAAITQAIAPEFRRIIQQRRALDGWQMVSVPEAQMFVLNIPTPSSLTPIQFVANMVSGAWCRFSGWNAASFATFGSRLYWGSKDGRVFLADEGGIDDTAAYTATIFPSFTDFGKPTLRKSMRLARANVQASFRPSGQFTMRTDFNFAVPPVPGASIAPPTGALWDTAIWDTDIWPELSVAGYGPWKTVNGLGSMISPVWQVTIGTAEDIDCRMTSIDVLYEVGEVIG